MKEYNTLMLGDIVGDTKRMVIACTKKAELVLGDSYAYWVAICVGEKEYHPYVVWNVIARPEGWLAESGDYCHTLQDALNVYKKRGGQ